MFSDSETAKINKYILAFHSRWLWDTREESMQVLYVEESQCEETEKLFKYRK